MDTDDERLAFAERLNEICSDMGLEEWGRQAALAKQFDVVGTAARKWLKGISYPELQLATAIAKWAGVNFEWLMTGRGPKHGNLIDMKALVLDEAMRSLGPEARREALDFIRYKLDRARAKIMSEKLGQYIVALDRYDELPPPPAPKPPRKNAR